MNDDGAADDGRDESAGSNSPREENPYASPHAPPAAPAPQEDIADEATFTPAQRLRRETTLRGLAVARLLAAGVVIAWGGFPWPGGLWTRAIVRLIAITVLLAVGLALWRLRRWALTALQGECLLMLVAVALLLDAPLQGSTAGLLAAAYLIAIQAAILQLLQAPLSRHVCSPPPRPAETLLSAPSGLTIVWKAALFSAFWAAGQFGALFILLRG